MVSRMNKRLILKIILNVALIFVGALFLTWFLEYRYFINNSGSAFNFVFERPKVFFFSALVIAIILIFIYALTFRPCLSISIVWTIIIILTYIHINKYVSRGVAAPAGRFSACGPGGSAREVYRHRGADSDDSGVHSFPFRRRVLRL